MSTIKKSSPLHQTCSVQIKLQHIEKIKFLSGKYITFGAGSFSFEIVTELELLREYETNYDKAIYLMTVSD